MLTIKLPDGNNLKFPKEVTGSDIAEKILLKNLMLKKCAFLLIQSIKDY